MSAAAKGYSPITAVHDRGSQASGYAELPAEADADFDRIATLTCRILDAPVALVTRIEPDAQLFPGSAGLPEPLQLSRRTPLSYSLCQYVVDSGTTLVIENAPADERVAANLAVTELGVNAYLGTPLTDSDGAILGSLCAIDYEPRDWTSQQIGDLNDLAALCSSELRLRGALAAALRASEHADWMLSTMPAGYVSVDGNWCVRACNAEGARMLGETVETIIGVNMWERWPAAVGTELEAFYRRVAATGVTEVMEMYYPDPLNEWFEARCQKAGDGLATYFTNITSRRETEARSAEILGAMPVGFVLLGYDWRVIAINELATEIIGPAAGDIKGTLVWEAVPSLIGSRFEPVLRRVAETGVAELIEAYYPEPFNLWFDVRIMSSPQGISVYFVDVSARHEIQVLLEQSAEHDRTVAQILQQALLSELPSVPGLELAGRYLTATGTDQVGGDWYDAVVQPDGAVTVSIGDVSGHDIAAAASMGQIRAMLRGFLWDNYRSPGEGVHRLDQAVLGHDLPVMASLVAAFAERTDGGGIRLRWTNAGHPPPILLRPDGTTEVLATRPELMLGVRPGVDRSDHALTLPVGSTLLLYTDGLIETQNESIAHGTTKLCEALERNASLGLAELLEAVLTELRADTRGDDVAVLALRVNALPELPGAGLRVERRAEPQELALTLASDVHAPAQARAYVAQHVAGLSEDLRERAAVLVSELVTNAVLHGEPVITLGVEIDESALTVTVHDGSSVLPDQHGVMPEPSATEGRGMPLLTALAWEWGVQADPEVLGKAVWFRLRRDHRQPQQHRQEHIS